MNSTRFFSGARQFRCLYQLVPHRCLQVQAPQKTFRRRFALSFHYLKRCYCQKVSITRLCSEVSSHRWSLILLGTGVLPMCAIYLPCISSEDFSSTDIFKLLSGLRKIGLFFVAHCESQSFLPNTSQRTDQLKQDLSSICDVSSCNKSSVLEATRLCLRAAHLLCVFIPLLMIYPLTCLRQDFFSVWLKLVYHTVERSGATFVKLGQWASTRRDLFSPEFCDCFSKLHHRVKPHPWFHTQKLMKEAYGPGWQSMFSLRDEQEPIGSGCIAQVYKGFVRADYVSPEILNDDSEDSNRAIFGEGVEIVTFEINPEDTAHRDHHHPHIPNKVEGVPVAIKVLHPEIRETFRRDLILMRWAARTLTFLFPKLHWVNLVQCVEEFSITMDKQLNMFHEARCLQRFAADFSDSLEIKVPKPVMPLMRKNVLVETFEEGVSIGQIVGDPLQPTELKEHLARIGIDVMLKMVFANNFVHADLHPGNLLVQNIDDFKTEKASVVQVDALDMMVVDVRPSTEPTVKLVLLDCGITASLDEDDRDKFRKVFTAVVKGDGDEVAELFLTRSAVNNCTDTGQFKKEMAQIVLKGRKNLMSISKIKVAELMQEVFSVLAKHKIQLESSFATIILAIAMLEGLGRSLDPNLDLLEKARPVLLGGI